MFPMILCTIMIRLNVRKYVQFAVSLVVYTDCIFILFVITISNTDFKMQVNAWN